MFAGFELDRSGRSGNNDRPEGDGRFCCEAQVGDLGRERLPWQTQLLRPFGHESSRTEPSWSERSEPFGRAFLLLGDC